MKGEQIPLSVQLRSSASFDTYYAGPNQAAVNALRESSRGGLFLYGAAGSGKTHLLQAAVREAAPGVRAGYLPLRELVQRGAEAVDGYAGYEMLCIDDLDAIADDTQWNHTLIRLLDRLRTEGARWCVSAAAAPERLGGLLPIYALGSAHCRYSRCARWATTIVTNGCGAALISGASSCRTTPHAGC